MQISMFSILTREAAGTVKDIHDRMPIILDKDNVLDWIRPNGSPSAIVEKMLTNMIFERAVDYPRFSPETITAYNNIEALKALSLKNLKLLRFNIHFHFKRNISHEYTEQNVRCRSNAQLCGIRIDITLESNEVILVKNKLSIRFF